MKIVNSCTCPLGATAGHDADECRANLVEDGSIICVTCATRYPKMSKRMHQVWRAIVASGFGVPSVVLGSNIQPGTDAYNASCLCGYDPNLSDRVQAHFNGGKGEVVRLDYDRSNEAEIDTPDLNVGRKLFSDELPLIPERLLRCIKALEREGFRVRHVGTELGLRVVMASGRSVGSMGAVIGVNVELCVG